MLEGKKIIIGVTGSIAAYKSASLVREFRNRGAAVRVVMTASSKDFITPLTLATLSQHRVYSDFTESKETGEWTNHVELGIWADLMVIAPASANTLAKMACGECDNFLLAVLLSSRCPIAVAPAMDLDMLDNEATVSNLQTLTDRGVHIIEPGTGPLASGLIGKGRMAEPDEIVEFCDMLFLNQAPLKGHRILVNAGPTFEPIDPVRFIGNRSTGKMGFAIAEELASRGALVELVTGPVSLSTPPGRINRMDVETAEQMHGACMRLWSDCQAAICTAAVADFKPTNVEVQKIKKGSSHLTLDLQPTVDVLAEMGRTKRGDQLLFGFALETINEEKNARLKLERKNADAIIINSLMDPGAGFATDTNRIKILSRSGEIFAFDLKSKQEVASDIVDYLCQLVKP
jgi:phosphopantothenoylcysteine decarboxylase / phosphopantothenate---cysteine ligase